MKKIISVLLTIAVIAGMFAFGASAQGTYLYGDADGDKKINSADALAVLQHSTGIKTFSRTQKAIADVDMNNVVNSADALEILKYSVSIISEFKKDYSKTLKYKKVDTIINTGTYTIKLNAVVEDQDTSFIFTAKGKEKAVSSSVKVNIKEMLGDEDLGVLAILLPSGETDFEMRFYTDKNGKNYMLFPLLKLYCEVEADMVPNVLADMLFAAEYVFEKSTEKTEGGKAVTEETFIVDSDADMTYKFVSGSLSKVSLVNDEGATDFNVKSISASADTSLLGIPSGYIYSSELASALGS